MGTQGRDMDSSQDKGSTSGWVKIILGFFAVIQTTLTVFLGLVNSTAGDQSATAIALTQNSYDLLRDEVSDLRADNAELRGKVELLIQFGLEDGSPPAVATFSDIDGDGFPDIADNCPHIAGESELDGCPEEAPEAPSVDSPSDVLAPPPPLAMTKGKQRKRPKGKKLPDKIPLPAKDDIDRIQQQYFK